MTEKNESFVSMQLSRTELCQILFVCSFESFFRKKSLIIINCFFFFRFEAKFLLNCKFYIKGVN